MTEQKTPENGIGTTKLFNVLLSASVLTAGIALPYLLGKSHGYSTGHSQGYLEGYKKGGDNILTEIKKGGDDFLTELIEKHRKEEEAVKKEYRKEEEDMRKEVSNLEKTLNELKSGICDLDLDLRSRLMEPTEERMKAYREALEFGARQAEKLHGIPYSEPHEFYVKELKDLEGSVLSIFGKKYKIKEALFSITKENEFDYGTHLLILKTARGDGETGTLSAYVLDNDESNFFPNQLGAFKNHKVHLEGRLDSDTFFTLTKVKVIQPR